MSKELENEIEDLTIHLADMLEATLHFAGVKEGNLEEAVKAYIDGLDDVFEDDDGEMGYKEIIEAVEHLKSNKSELFE
ncbi:MAG TPA: hypothetical protein EYH01_05980 [Campylobacterales bacterium]|nr:hypothetical protein [Campylobacterales bacterium]HIP59957.1 hypothetical protein [Campylobacterales bacterium]